MSEVIHEVSDFMSLTSVYVEKSYFWGLFLYISSYNRNKKTCKIIHGYYQCTKTFKEVSRTCQI